MNRPLRTVVIGFGQVADQLGDDPLMAHHFDPATHAQALSRHPAFAWDAVVDPSQTALDRAAEKWNIHHRASNVEAVQQAFDPEIAVVTAPAAARPAILAALPNLRAVMVEKPLGTQPGEAAAYLAPLFARRLPVQVNFWRRGAEGFRDLAQGGLQELVGQAQAVFATYGNGLRNNGSHLIDFVAMMLGDIVDVRATGPAHALAGAPIPGDVHLPFVLGLARGPAVMVQPLDFNAYREVGLDIWGDRGRLSIMQEGLAALYHPVAGNRGLEDAREIASDRPQAISCPVDTAFYEMYDNLAKAVHDETVTLFSPAISAMATEAVIEAMLSSAAAGGTRVALA